MRFILIKKSRCGQIFRSCNRSYIVQIILYCFIKSYYYLLYRNAYEPHTFETYLKCRLASCKICRVNRRYFRMLRTQTLMNLLLYRMHPTASPKMYQFLGRENILTKFDDFPFKVIISLAFFVCNTKYVGKWVRHK